MSVYGYGRRTTPWLERLAAEGAVFENAYSNSSFTKTSVPSFMTSLHSSVLGATRSAADGLPARAATMAERKKEIPIAMRSTVSSRTTSMIRPQSRPAIRGCQAAARPYPNRGVLTSSRHPGLR